METFELTKTLVINPAFLQEIKDSNPDLWDIVHGLRIICESSDDSIDTVRRMTRLLDELRDQLSLQFALEEAYGFIEMPAGVPGGPDSDDIMQAHRQHCGLYLRLSELAEQAEELQYRGVERQGFRGLIASTQAFDAQFRAHERLEGDLISRSLHMR